MKQMIKPLFSKAPLVAEESISAIFPLFSAWCGNRRHRLKNKAESLSISRIGRCSIAFRIRLKAFNNPAQGNALRNGIHHKSKPRRGGILMTPLQGLNGEVAPSDRALPYPDDYKAFSLIVRTCGDQKIVG